MSHIWMSHVTHMNESCHTYEWVMSHIWMSLVTHMNESCHTYEWVMSHIWMSTVSATHVNVFATHYAHCNTLQLTATHCNTLQHAATHCSTLQHTAKHCNTLQHTAIHVNVFATHTNVFLCFWHVRISHSTHMNDGTCGPQTWMAHVCHTLHIHTYMCIYIYTYMFVCILTTHEHIYINMYIYIYICIFSILRHVVVTRTNQRWLTFVTRNMSQRERGTERKRETERERERERCAISMLHIRHIFVTRNIWGWHTFCHESDLEIRIRPRNGACYTYGTHYVWREVGGWGRVERWGAGVE